MDLRVKPVFFNIDRTEALARLNGLRDLMPPHVVLLDEVLFDKWEDLHGHQGGLEPANVLLELSADLRPVPARSFTGLEEHDLILPFGSSYSREEVWWAAGRTIAALICVSSYLP